MCSRMQRATGTGSFGAKLLVEHPERVDDLLLDVDVAHSRRNVEEGMLGLVTCIADAYGLAIDAS